MPLLAFSSQRDPEALLFFGSNFSNNCARVLLMLEEKSLVYEKRSVDLVRGKNLRSNYLAIHPQGTVPAIVHRNQAISNSNEIMRYIESTFPEPSLSAGEFSTQVWASVDKAAKSHLPAIKAQFYALGLGRSCSDSDLELYRVHHPELYAFHAKYRKGISERQAKDIKTLNHELLSDLERSLESSDYLFNDQYSAADIAWVANVIFLDRMGFDLSRYQKVRAWTARIASRPAYNKRSRIPEVPILALRVMSKLTKLRG